MNVFLPHSEKENRRASLRLQMTEAKRLRLRLVSYEGCSVNLKPGFIDLQDLGPGGCGFRSPLRFPVTPRLLLMIEGELAGMQLAFLGHLCWNRREENGYRYGMRFLLSFDQRLLLHYLLNGLVLKTCPGQAKIHQLYQSRVSSGTG